MSNFYRSYDSNKAVLFCNCGCDEGIRFDYWEEDNELFLNFVTGKFYAGQGSQPFRKLKRIWAVIRGQEYYLSEMVLNTEDLEELRRYICSLGRNRVKKRTDNPADHAFYFRPHRSGVALKFEFDDMIFLALTSDTDYKRGRIFKKLKQILTILMNKEYRYYEIVMERRDIVWFKKFMASLPR